MNVLRKLASCLLVLAVVCSATVASAQEEGPTESERAAARDIGEQAVAAYKEGDYKKALGLFERAHAIVGLTTTGLYIARCLVKLLRFVEASERYVEVSRMELPADALDVHVRAKATAQKEREALLPRIPKLMISLDEPSAEDAVVTLDGAKVPAALLGVSRPVDPGKHVIVATRGDIRREQEVDLAEGQTRNLTLSVKVVEGDEPPRPPPPPEPDEESETNVLQTVGWVAVGVGGAALVMGAITGGLAIDKRSQLEKGCPEMQCPPEQFDNVDTYQTLRIVSGVGLIGGGVIAAAGIVMVAVSTATADEQQTVRLELSPTGFAITGRF